MLDYYVKKKKLGMQIDVNASEGVKDGTSARLRPWSTMDNEPEPSHGIPCLGFSRKTDQFQLDPTQR